MDDNITDFSVIPMSNVPGVFATIDPEDYERVNVFGKWHRNDSGYAVKKGKINGKNTSIRMHNLINNTPKGLVTDHINGDRLDNRRKNLRTVSVEMNTWNRHRDKPHFIYPDLPKGISFDINRNQYVASRTLRRRFNTLIEAQNFVAASENEL